MTHPLAVLGVALVGRRSITRSRGYKNR